MPLFTYNPTHNRNSVWRRSLCVLVLRGVAVVLLFCVDIILGRTMGPSWFGIYSNTLAIIMILMTISLMGLENMLIREVSTSLKAGFTGYTRQIIKLGVTTTTGLSVLISILFSFYIYFINPYDNQMMQQTICIGILLLPMVVFTSVSGIVLRGFHKILTGQFVQYVIQPIVFAVGIATFYIYGSDLTPAIAMIISAIGWCVATVMAIVLLKRRIYLDHSNSTKSLLLKSFFTTSLLFAIVAGVQMTNARVDIILLYWLGGDSEAGIYSATVRICDLLIFSIIAINISIGPTISTLHHSGESKKLQSLVVNTARISSIVSLPILLLAATFSQPLLSLFGHGFSGHHWSLVVLCLGQMVVVLTGSKALLLLMSGEERITAVVLGITAVFHLVTSFILIPQLGIMGAAISTTSSVVCWSLLLTCVSIRKLGIDPTVLNAFSRVGAKER